jgi:hypothetical protein
LKFRFAIARQVVNAARSVSEKKFAVQVWKDKQSFLKSLVKVEHFSEEAIKKMPTA